MLCVVRAAGERFPSLWAVPSRPASSKRAFLSRSCRLTPASSREARQANAFTLASAEAGNSGTHGQWDSLESSPAVANPRGAIPTTRQPVLGSPTAVLLRRTEHARKQANARNRRISISYRCPRPTWHRLGSPKQATPNIEHNQDHGRRRDAAAPANRCARVARPAEHVATISDEARAHSKPELFGDRGGLRVRGSEI